MFGLGQLGKLGSVGRALAAWTPAQLYPLGASSPGMWIDPPYTASLFSTSAGTTAISAIGTVLDTSNPVGLILDRKGNLELGPELVTNGDFSNGSTGWTLNSWTVSGGAANGNSASSNLQTSSTVGAATGKTYQVTFTVLNYVSGNVSPWVRGTYGTTRAANGTFTEYIVAGASSDVVLFTAVAFNGSIDNISVREIPGIHLSQATATSRPVASARVNLLTYSEDFSNAIWTKSAGTVTDNQSTAPDGSSTAALIQPTSANSALQQTVGVQIVGVPLSAGIWIRSVTGSFSTTVNIGQVDFANKGTTVVSVTTTWQYATVTFTPVSEVSHQFYIGGGTTFSTGEDIYIWHPQLNLGSTALPYQRVGAASDYDASAGPTYTKLDGTDDSLVSATFAAGTLTSSMDALIAVRRDSAANVILGLYQTANSSPQFGVCTIGDFGGYCYNGVGSPTVWIDGAQLPGGSAIFAGDLELAITPGSWHIMEFRGMDMSAWTAAKIGINYSGWQINGGIGGIQLFASGQDANRDLARAQMAAYFGVTLP